MTDEAFEPEVLEGRQADGDDAQRLVQRLLDGLQQKVRRPARVEVHSVPGRAAVPIGFSFEVDDEHALPVTSVESNDVPVERSALRVTGNALGVVARWRGLTLVFPLRVGEAMVDEILERAGGLLEGRLGVVEEQPSARLRRIHLVRLDPPDIPTAARNGQGTDAPRMVEVLRTSNHAAAGPVGRAPFLVTFSSARWLDPQERRWLIRATGGRLGRLKRRLGEMVFERVLAMANEKLNERLAERLTERTESLDPAPKDLRR